MDTQANSRDKKILVADDEDSVRYLVRRLLGGKHTVLEASDGEQAVELAQTHKPDIILMDMKMPKKDGLTACAEIRSNPETRTIPIILLTGLGYEPKAESAGVGATGYVAKPFKSQDLISAIDNCWSSGVSLVGS